MDYKDYFKNKKIVLMGLGILGRGLGDAKFLAKYAKSLLVTDLKKPGELKSSIDSLKKYKNIKLVLGRHRVEDFKNADLVIKGAGVPLDSPFIKAAQDAGIKIAMSTALFAKFFRESGKKVVGITGTRGKSTVTHLIYHVLKKAGFKALLGGNVLGVSTLAQLERMKNFEAAVLELDSWQLQGFDYEKISPDISVFTTFYRDHMNYYKDNINMYLADKAKIFLNQTGDDFFIVGEQAWSAIRKKYESRITSKIIKAKTDNLPKGLSLRILGEHNRYNGICSIEALRCLGLNEREIKRGAESFSGVKGRLEFVGERDKVKFYNDTTATTPEATIAALKALNPQKIKKTILIAGGADKNLEAKELIKEMKKRTRQILLLSGTGTEKIKSKLPELKIFQNLRDAFKEALSIARKGDIILFSPAFASFGMFKNESDRGEKFDRLVKKTIKK